MSTTAVTVTNPKGKQEPMWYRLGRRHPVTDAFKNSHRGACINQTHIFFSDDLSSQALAKKICADCPVLHACTLWALNSADCDTEWGIVAGMDPDHRRRIREGREHYWDWVKEFNYAERARRAASRKGISKRDRQRREMPPCPGCGSNQYVSRRGRDKKLDRQRYQCSDCGPDFLGEAL